MFAFARRDEHSRIFGHLISEEKRHLKGEEYVLAEEFFTAAIQPLRDHDPHFAEIFNSLDNRNFGDLAESFAHLNTERVSDIPYSLIRKESREKVEKFISQRVDMIILHITPEQLRLSEELPLWAGPDRQRDRVPYDQLQNENGKLDPKKIAEEIRRRPFGLYQKKDLLAIVGTSGETFWASGLKRYEGTLSQQNGENIYKFWSAVNNLTTYGRGFTPPGGPDKPKREWVKIPEFLKGGFKPA